MITGGQLRAARALLGLGQRELSAMADLSVPTIHRMETSAGVIRGSVGSLTKIVEALDAAGVEFISPSEVSYEGGRGVRLKPARPIVGRGAGERSAPIRAT